MCCSTSLTQLSPHFQPFSAAANACSCSAVDGCDGDPRHAKGWKLQTFQEKLGADTVLSLLQPSKKKVIASSL